ncbi:hypothetical protein GJ496_007542 [Pomphorhynchus laevis]|nr:hypothetical protein GJ496_007542 [Pomphorhynchus laevis]
MIYMVIVPILPSLLNSSNQDQLDSNRSSQSSIGQQTYGPQNRNTSTSNSSDGAEEYIYDHADNEDMSLTLIFAIKAILQLFVSPMSGYVIDQFGSKKSMFVGLSLLASSTGLFAFSNRYGILLSARCLQGIGSAFADTSGFSLIAETFTEIDERSTALGISLAFISFGTLAAPPFGGIFYQLFGRRIPFLILACIALGDLIFFLIISQYRNIDISECGSVDRKRAYTHATPIWKLLMDPYIAICAGALSVANICLAFIESTIAIWMMKTMKAQSWQIGFVWFPAFLPHWIGVYLSVWLMKHQTYRPWTIAASGLLIEAIMCVFVPICTNYWVLMIPISGICFGNAIIDTTILPMVGHLTDTRHSPVYGSSYAIVDISYNLAYAMGPIVAGSIMHTIGFTYMNMIIFCVTIAYIPLMKRLDAIEFSKNDIKTTEIENLINNNGL